MLTNYIKVALRSLAANKAFSIINISSLAIGIASSILIITIVLHEFSYDHFHINGERIFRAEKQFTRDGRHSLFANPQFAPSLMQADARVENYVRTFNGAGRILKSDDSHIFFEDKLLFADTSFFGMFSFPLIQGDRSLLEKTSTAIITESIAQKYFGSLDVIGKTLTLDKIYPLTIVGVAKDAPVNSTIQFGVIVSFNTLLSMPFERDVVLNNSSGFPTYVLLRDKNDLPEVRRSIEVTKYTNKDIIYSLSPLYENHFNLNFGSTASTRYAYAFLSVAGLILLLALINYMNLTTARATTRAKEVGIRKIIGANRRSLSFQFYFESALTTLLSFIFALIIVELSRPMLTNLLGLSLDVSFLSSPVLYLSVGGLLLVCVIIAGSYPAIILPSFKPGEVLKGNAVIQSSRSLFRKTLTVFQFAVSVALAIGAFVMINQLSFMGKFDTGINRDHVLAIPVKTFSTASRHALKTELLSTTAITSASIASAPLYRSNVSGLSMITSPFNDEKIGARWIIADQDFVSTLNIKTVSNSGKSGTTYQLLNESAAKAFGMNDQSATRSITMGGDHAPAISGEISGVLRNFNVESLRSPVQPLILSIVADSAAYIGDNPTMYIRFSAVRSTSIFITMVSEVYNKFSDGSPFTYFFLDDAYQEQQLSETHMQQVFTIFAAIALIIASMGLFGLVTFSSERRKKELSIRKLLGATVSNLVILVSSEIFLLLILGITIAIPSAYYSSKEWLSGFFYQVSISIASVVVPVVVALFMAISVVGVQGLISALSNPAKNLKSE